MDNRLRLLVCLIAMRVVAGDEHTSGMRVTVAESILKQINTAELADIRANLQGRQFPDASGKDGDFEWSVRNIRINNIGFLTSSIDIGSSNQIKWSGYLSSIRLQADWRVSYDTWIGSISDSGGVTLSASGTAVDFTITVAVSSGSIGMTLSQCRRNIGGVTLDIDGNLPDAIYDLVEGPIEDILEDKMEDAICDAVKKGLDSLTDDMETLDTTYDIKLIGVPMALDYSLTDISTTNSQISTLHEGAIVWRGQRFETNTNVSFPVPSQKSVSFDLREDAVNNLLEAFTQSRELNGDLTFKEILEEDMHQFALTCRPNEMCVGRILRQTAQNYPDRVLSLAWNISQSSLSIESGSISGSLTGRTDFFAANASHQTFLFSALMDMSVSFQIRFSKGVLETRASGLSGSITIDRSNIGKIFPEDELRFIQNVLLPGINSDIEKMLNEYNTSLPIKLPKGVIFKSTKIDIFQHVIRVEADICYKTPTCSVSDIESDWVGSTRRGSIQIVDLITTTTPPTTPPTTTTIPTTSVAVVNGDGRLASNQTSGVAITYGSTCLCALMLQLVWIS